MKRTHDNSTPKHCKAVRKHFDTNVHGMDCKNGIEIKCQSCGFYKLKKDEHHPRNYIFYNKKTKIWSIVPGKRIPKRDKQRSVRQPQVDKLATLQTKDVKKIKAKLKIKGNGQK